MKILVISKSIPFPPRNGVELPLAHFFERIGQQHEVDFLIISQDKASFEERLPNVPNRIRKTMFLKPRLLPLNKRLWNEISGKHPAFFAYTYDEAELKNLVQGLNYDFVWVNPPGNITFLKACEALGLKFYQFSILGLNDLITSIYSKHLQEMVHRKIWDWRFISFWLRSFWISTLERKYLYDFDYIHLQTEKEAQKAIELVKDPTFRDRIIVCPNGIKSQFWEVEYEGQNSKGILYMTHLDGERKEESKWFIQKVWPLIKAETDAELWLIGTPPAQFIPGVSDDDRVKVLGFVEDLTVVYKRARMAVIPIFHNCGLINRILDGLTAGLPIVTTEIAAQTFIGVQNGKHLFTANTPDLFAEKTIMLYQDSQIRMSFSKIGRAYAISRPTWEEGTQLLLNKMEQKFTTHDW